MRRKQWEYRAQAVSVINAYAEAMNPKAAQTPPSNGTQPQPQAQRSGLGVSGDTMLRMLGAKGL